MATICMHLVFAIPITDQHGSPSITGLKSLQKIEGAKGGEKDRDILAIAQQAQV